VISVTAHWYLRYGLSYRDVEESLAERGVQVDHLAVPRRCLALPARRRCRWFVGETYVEVAGRWIYLYHAVDKFGQVVVVFVADQDPVGAFCSDGADEPLA
jgi:IS6 family transposase